jgi:cob(I)alamin adenosyltransferase
MVTKKQKASMAIVYTGEGKGKTTAGLGLACRALGHGDRVAFIQFIKDWVVSEDTFLQTIMPLYGRKLRVYKGGKGFYNAGDMSAPDISEGEHKQAAKATFEFALNCATSGKYDLVVCDEINNAVHDGLLQESDLATIIANRYVSTSLCFMGRNFPADLYDAVDIMTNMKVIRHHYDEGYIAKKGIDY